MLRYLGARLYGFGSPLASWLGYAGLAELGVLVTLPWLVADADGRRDRRRIRELVSTGVAAATFSTLIYGRWRSDSGHFFRRFSISIQASAVTFPGRC